MKNNVISQLKEYAIEDIRSAIKNVNKKYGLNKPIEFESLTYECTADIENDDNYDIDFFANLSTGLDDVLTCVYTYHVDTDSVTLLDDIEDIIYGEYVRNKSKVNSSISISAADDDIEDSSDSSEADDEYDEDENMKNHERDFTYEEDEPNIEIDNNIADHYIAECDYCGGIFISAVKQSDQDISHITGICPICDRETNQYLKWIIKDIE